MFVYKDGEIWEFNKKIYYNEQNQVEIYKVEDIKPIVTDGMGRFVDIIKIDLDSLDMAVEESSEKLSLNIRYNKKLHAYFTDSYGGKSEVELEQKDGGVQVSLPLSKGVLTIKYENIIYFLGIILAAIYFPVILVLMIYVFVKGWKKWNL